MTKQTQVFQAETKELLDLMIHSLYSHREIFLRELISNAADAIEKLKFEALTHPALVGSETAFEIRLEADAEKKTLSISDTGIGMTSQEVMDHIGTIARSGTRAFLKMKTDMSQNPELIGQFGVGFYSAFMVADRVTLHTQKAGTSEGVFWESEGQGTYTIEERVKPSGHGTTITLYLKDFSQDHSEEAVQNFTDFWTLKEIVQKYSDFVPYPIRMQRVVREKDEVKTEDEVLNSQKALWLKSPSDISQEEYREFYRHLSQDWNEPLKTVHYRAEGTFEFTALMYFPSQKPFNYDYRDRKIGLSLYVKRVLIQNDCRDLLPEYLRFVKGLVDSSDLPLNVSREILQQDRQIVRIRKALTGKVLNTLKEWLESDRATYEQFWTHFGATLKEGIALDAGQIPALQELLLFVSTASEGKPTRLKEYVSRMKPDQKAIYYITGDSLEQVQHSPYLEKLKAKGLEVLLMVDSIDAWVVSHLHEYDGKSLQSITAADLDLTEESEKETQKEKLKAAEEKLKPLLETMQEKLKDRVKEIKISDRLTESPVCLVASSNATSAHMERILESMGQGKQKAQRILEINPGHPLYDQMLHLPKSHQENWADLLYQQALLNEGSRIDNPLEYSQKIAQLMVLAGNQIERSQ